MATTEIEKLERRYAENPQGLTFAPLAEVHRKNGDIPRALELLKSGLELHPNYIPASIVLGRCHLDQADLPAAESAFAHVLRLDDENVIALKSLAEISERLGRAAEAQRWLKRLISIDRSNEEARQHLVRLEGAKPEPGASGEAPPAAVPPVAAATPAPPPAAAELPPVPAEPARPVPPTPQAMAEEPAVLDLTAAIADPAPLPKSEARDEPPSPAPALEFLDTSEPPRRAEPAVQPADASLIQEEAATPGESAPVDGLISQEFVPPKEGGYRLHPELTQEFGTAAESVEQLEVETAAEVELQSSGASEFRVPNAAEDFKDLMESARAPERQPELEIEPPPPTPTVPAPIASAPAPAPSPPPPTPARASYSARETRGRSVADFFQAMLNARPPGSAPPSGSLPAGSVPTQRPEASPTAPNSPSQATPGSPVTPAAPSPDAAVSFDDFFGAPTGSSGGTKESSDAGEDDLDQFQSWLQNLKR